MVIGAATIGKGSAAKKHAVKQFLEQTMAKKSLTQQIGRESGVPGTTAHTSVDRMKQTSIGFNVSDIESSLIANTQTNGGGSLPANGNRYQSTMYNQNMRQKNLRINRNNIANIQLDKKGQAVQVHLKSAIAPENKSMNIESNL